MAVDSRCGYYLQQAEEETFQNNKFLNKCLGPGLQRLSQQKTSEYMVEADTGSSVSQQMFGTGSSAACCGEQRW